MLAFAVVAGLQVVAAAVLGVMRTTPVRRVLDGPPVHPVRQTFIDLRDGFAYLLQTRWLLATLIFSILLVFVIMGPIEVLLPFAVKDQRAAAPVPSPSRWPRSAWAARSARSPSRPCDCRGGT